MEQTYVTFGNGEYAVIHQSLPICANKHSLAEALAAAKQCKLIVGNEAWNGERGEWVHLNTIEVTA